MMSNCVSYHPQAAYDKDGVVVDLISFGGHEQDVINQVISALGYSGSLSICEMGPIFIGDSWNGESIVRRVDPAPVFAEQVTEEDLATEG